MFNGITPIQSVGDLIHIKYPLSVRSGTFLPLVIFYMGLMRVQAAGIVDEKNNCIGFVTSEDLIDFSDGSKCNSKYPRITDVMRAPNMAVYLDDPIEQAMIMMNLHKVDWLPVIDFDTQHFSGLVCRKDIENLPKNIIDFPKRNFAYGDAA